MSMTTWADIRPGDRVMLKGDDWWVTDAEHDHLGTVVVTVKREGRIVGPRHMDSAATVERVEHSPAPLPNLIGDVVRAAEGELAAAEAVAQVQLGAVVIGRKDGTAPWQVVGVDETMIHAHLYTFHGIDVVAVGSAAEAMALHLADHAAAVKAGAFVEHEHVS